jgi:HNH endonuclease
MSDIIPKRTRRAVAERAKGCCEYCRSQERFAPVTFSVEHILPRQAGGTSAAENLAFSCQECNNHKYTKTEAHDPASDKMVPLYHPRQHRWIEHFAWDEDFTFLIGISPTGRATVEALQLNRQGVVNLRRVLYEMGEHPPLIEEQNL